MGIGVYRVFGIGYWDKERSDFRAPRTARKSAPKTVFFPCWDIRVKCIREKNTYTIRVYVNLQVYRFSPSYQLITTSQAYLSGARHSLSEIWYSNDE